MPTAVANGRKFNFPEGTTPEQMGAAIDEFMSQQQQPQQPQQEQPKLSEGSTLGGVSEALLSIGSGVASTAAGGLAGIAQTLNPFAESGAGAEAVKSVQEGGTYQPRTQKGQETLQTIGDLIQKGVDIVNFPISGLAGLAELITGQGVEQAAKTVKDVQEKGVGKTAGDRTYELTGDPLLSTVAETTPAIVASVLPVAKIVNKNVALKAKIAAQIKSNTANPELANQLTNITKDIKSGVIKPENINQVLSTVEEQARKTSGPIVANKISNISQEIASGNTEALTQLDNIANKVSQITPEQTLTKYLVNGAGKLKTDSLAQETIKQGFDQGVVAVIKGSSKLDKEKMLRMVETIKKGKENALYAMKNRPSDIAGNSLLERVNYVKKINKDASSKIDGIAKSLKGKTADSSTAIDNLFNNLDEMGIKLNKNLRPNFAGSDIDGLKGPQLAIANLTKRIKSGNVGASTDAYELHRIKKYIDEIVTYGKKEQGLSGKTERILKQFRRDIDSTLDNNYPAYNKVNSVYSDTVNALDSLQNVAGKKLDLFGPNADKATGTLLRRMMSNVQSRVNLVDAVDELNNISKKYGANFNDDISAQMLFVDELDSVFGPVARTSLAGETAKGFKTGAATVLGQKTLTGTAIEAGAAGVEKLRGITKENALKSIEELLKRQ